jgi:hypothetical protein
MKDRPPALRPTSSHHVPRHPWADHTLPADAALCLVALSAMAERVEARLAAFRVSGVPAAWPKISNAVRATKGGRRMSSEGEPGSPKPYDVGWNRSAQDAAEAEFPPREPESEPKVRVWPLGRILVVFMAVMVLWALFGWLTGHGPLG